MGSWFLWGSVWHWSKKGAGGAASWDRDTDGTGQKKTIASGEKRGEGRMKKKNNGG